jgi:hypothetical protein
LAGWLVEKRNYMKGNEQKWKRKSNQNIKKGRNFFIELFELKNPTSVMRWKQQQATSSSELLYFYFIYFVKDVYLLFSEMRRCYDAV